MNYIVLIDLTVRLIDYLVGNLMTYIVLIDLTINLLIDYIEC